MRGLLLLLFVCCSVVACGGGDFDSLDGPAAGVAGSGTAGTAPQVWAVSGAPPAAGQGGAPVGAGGAPAAPPGGTVATAGALPGGAGGLPTSPGGSPPAEPSCDLEVAIHKLPDEFSFEFSYQGPNDLCVDGTVTCTFDWQTRETYPNPHLIRFQAFTGSCSGTGLRGECGATTACSFGASVGNIFLRLETAPAGDGYAITGLDSWTFGGGQSECLPGDPSLREGLIEAFQAELEQTPWPCPD